MNKTMKKMRVLRATATNMPIFTSMIFVIV